MNTRFLFNQMFFLLFSVIMMACSDSGTEVTGDVEVAAVTVSPATLNLNIGETQRLTLTIQPENASAKSGVWSSSDESVATVSDDGTVTAQAEGNVTITVKVGDKSATCEVTVAASASEEEDNNDATLFDLTKLTGAELAKAIADASAAGITRFTLKGDYAALNLVENNPFVGIYMESLDLSGVTGWPEVSNGQAGVPRHAFYDKDIRIQELVLPEAVKAVGSYAFSQCVMLTSVTAPGLQTVEPYAFQYCSALKKVSMPQVTSIGESAFFNSALVEADFPVLTSVGNLAFHQCASLVSVNMPQLTALGEIAPLYADQPIEASVFGKCSALVSVSLPKVTVVGDMVFESCKSLMKIELPEATDIGIFSFRGCSALQEVSLPKAVNINDYAFADCPALRTILLVTPNNIAVYSSAFGESNSQTQNITLTLASQNSSQVDQVETPDGKITYTWNGYEWKHISYK